MSDKFKCVCSAGFETQEELRTHHKTCRDWQLFEEIQRQGGRP